MGTISLESNLERSAVVEPVARPPAGERLVSLDAYRGLIMLTLLAGAIFRSLKGDPMWNWLSIQNDHARWRGCVYWDLIQPSFMFMVGVAMPFALSRRAAVGEAQKGRVMHGFFRAFNL